MGWKPLEPQLQLSLPGAEGLVERFLGRQKPATRQAYDQDLQDFARFVGAESAQAAALQLLAGGPGLANQLVHDYLVQLRQKGLASATINRRLSALRSLVRLARLFQLISWTLELPGEKLERYRDTRGLGLGGMRRLLGALDEREDAKAARDRAILRLAFDLGLRRGELASLDLEHLDLEAGTVAVRGKGQEGRELLTLPPETVMVLRAWLEQRGLEPGPLFLNFDRAQKGRRLTSTSIYRIVRELGDQVQVKARPHGVRHAAITAVLDLSQGDVRAAADFGRNADIRTLTLHDDNRQSLGGRMAALLAAALNGTVQDGRRERGASARTVPDPLDQLDLKVGLLIEEWQLPKELSQADVEGFTAEDARQNLRNDIRDCRFLLDTLEGLLPAAIEGEGGLDAGSVEQDSEASPHSAADEAVMGNHEDPEGLSLTSFLTPSDLLQQGKITRGEYQIFLRVMALSNPSGPLEEPQALSEWPQTATKAQSERRDYVRRTLEKQLRSAQLTRMGLPRINVTVLPEPAPTRSVAEVPLSVVPTKGETIEHLLRRGAREYQLWVDRLEPADVPPGVHRQAELPRFLDWYRMYLANLSVNQIAARSEAPEGRPYDRKTVAYGIDVVAKMMGQKRVRGSERFVLLDDEPMTD